MKNKEDKNRSYKEEIIKNKTSMMKELIDSIGKQLILEN